MIKRKMRKILLAIFIAVIVFVEKSHSRSYSQQHYDSIKIGEWMKFLSLFRRENVFKHFCDLFLLENFKDTPLSFFFLWWRRKFPWEYVCHSSQWFSFLILIVLSAALSLQVVFLMIHKKPSLFSNMPCGKLMTSKCSTTLWDVWMAVMKKI